MHSEMSVLSRLRVNRKSQALVARVDGDTSKPSGVKVNLLTTIFLEVEA